MSRVLTPGDAGEGLGERGYVRDGAGVWDSDTQRVSQASCSSASILSLDRGVLSARVLSVEREARAPTQPAATKVLRQGITAADDVICSPADVVRMQSAAHARLQAKVLQASAQEVSAQLNRSGTNHAALTCHCLCSEAGEALCVSLAQSPQAVQQRMVEAGTSLGIQAHTCCSEGWHAP
jgi:hypothetical protein